ncbi:Rha family transcriptional regulator [Jeotgalibacillus terrae]|uniref:Rha family transcriptional regulator n=1 Tax=Jeotgalibacillus terrae TaxID=587735 RepID=A0ABW5ZEJ6_9BACL|nr:Rha family transcriptional regulator [Jeotgalibacillus terrae]MBM7580054.1 Rha family phage regulatory protein [Jeotgalibacillus terrae]
MSTTKDLVFNKDGIAVTDSRDVADMIDKRHNDLLRTIKGYVDILENAKLRSVDFFIPSSYKTSGNLRSYECFLLTRKGCDMVANKMTGEKGVLFTAAYTTQFEEMEQQLKSPKPLTDQEQRIAVLQATLEHEKKFEQFDERMEKLENNTRIDAFQQTVIQKQIGKRVARVHDDENLNPDQLDKKKIYPQLHRNLRDSFRVPSYRDIRRIDFDDAVSWIRNWRPMI